MRVAGLKVMLAVCTMMMIFANQNMSSTTADQTGEQLYKAKCATCHGAEGKDEAPPDAADRLADLGSPEVQKKSDADLTAIIANGKNKMAGYAKTLKPEQIKSLVAYIRSFRKKP